MSKSYEMPDEEMTVTLDFDFGSYECEIITVLEVDNKDYIALTPIVAEEDELYGQVWFYELKENPDDPNEEPELIEIEDDNVLEAVDDAFDEYLDSQEYDEIIED